MEEIVIDLSRKYIPNPKQALAHIALAKYTLFGGAMGGGKSVYLCTEGLQLSLDYPGNRGFIGRYEFSTFKLTTYLTLMEFIPPQLIKQHNKMEHVIRLVNGSTIYYGGVKATHSEKPVDRLKSMEWGWFAFDEASEIPEHIYTMMQTRLRFKLPDGSRPRYRGLLASNPESGWLESRFINEEERIKKKRKEIFIQALPSDNIENLPKGYIDAMRENLPPELYQRYALGVWGISERKDMLYNPILVNQSMDRGMGKEEPCEFGVDVARYGDCKTVIACRWGSHVEIKYVGSQEDIMQTAGRVAKLADELNPISIKVDASGMPGVHDRLKEMNYSVEEIVSGEKAHDPERFWNFRAEAHWLIRERMEQDMIDLPQKDMELRGQLTNIRYKIKSDKRILIESKEDMRRRGAKSPDKADAIVLAFCSKPRNKARIYFFGDSPVEATKPVRQDKGDSEADAQNNKNIKEDDLLDSDRNGVWQRR